MASYTEKPYPKFYELLTPELRAKLILLPEAERARLFKVLALTFLTQDRPFRKA